MGVISAGIRGLEERSSDFAGIFLLRSSSSRLSDMGVQDGAFGLSLDSKRKEYPDFTAVFSISANTAN
jgi:hypothetical protein